MKYGKRHAESELIKSNFEMAELNEKKLMKKGAKAERKRIIKLLKEQNVIRNCGATGKLVFVNCNNLDVLYLKDDLLNELSNE